MMASLTMTAESNKPSPGICCTLDLYLPFALLWGGKATQLETEHWSGHLAVQMRNKLQSRSKRKLLSLSCGQIILGRCQENERTCCGKYLVMGNANGHVNELE